MKLNKALILTCVITISIAELITYSDKFTSHQPQNKAYQLHGINNTTPSGRTIFATNFTAMQNQNFDHQWQFAHNNYLLPNQFITNTSNSRSYITPITYNLNFETDSKILNNNQTANDAESNLTPVINDLDYNESSSAESTAQEIIFITDNQQNQLISCTNDNKNSQCHVAVSNLNNPQDILILGNYIYIINSHATGSNGDITRCQINNNGLITHCSIATLNMINPVFFSYQPPYVYISDFVWSGGNIKPNSSLQCSVDSYGDLINCTPEYNLTSMNFISKEYQGYYYRAHSYPAPATIEKCSYINSTQCQELINPLLEYPLNLRVASDYIYITNAVANGQPSVLKCSLDLLSCQIITNQLPSPMCIAIFTTQNS